MKSNEAEFPIDDGRELFSIPNSEQQEGVSEISIRLSDVEAFEAKIAQMRTDAISMTASPVLKNEPFIKKFLEEYGVKEDQPSMEVSVYDGEQLVYCMKVNINFEHIDTEKLFTLKYFDVNGEEITGLHLAA